MEALKRTTPIFLLLTMTLMVIAPAESAEGAGLKVVAEKCSLGSTVTAAIS